MKTFTYIYRADYGSPEVDQTTPTITKVEVGKDGKSVRLYVDGLQEGHIHDLTLPGVRSGGRPAAAAPAGVLHAELLADEVKCPSALRRAGSVSDRRTPVAHAPGSPSSESSRA